MPHVNLRYVAAAEFTLHKTLETDLWCKSSKNKRSQICLSKLCLSSCCCYGQERDTIAWIACNVVGGTITLYEVQIYYEWESVLRKSYGILQHNKISSTSVRIVAVSCLAVCLLIVCPTVIHGCPVHLCICPARVSYRISSQSADVLAALTMDWCIVYINF